MFSANRRGRDRVKFEKGTRVRARRGLGNFWSGSVTKGSKGTVVDSSESWTGGKRKFKVRFEGGLLDEGKTVGDLTDEDIEPAGSW